MGEKNREQATSTYGPVGRTVDDILLLTIGILIGWGAAWAVVMLLAWLMWP